MKTFKLFAPTKNSPLREGMSSPARQGCVYPRREVHTPNPSQEGNCMLSRGCFVVPPRNEVEGSEGL